MEILGKPYIEYALKNNVVVRFFSLNIEDNELKWHKDLEDRIIWTLEESNWSFQLDNELPIHLDANRKILIKKGTYHRLIKGDNDLILIISKQIK